MLLFAKTQSIAHVREFSLLFLPRSYKKYENRFGKERKSKEIIH